jgi:hypothetical protein
MSLLCQNKMSPHQRRYLRVFGAMLGITAFFTMLMRDAIKSNHLSRPVLYALAVLSAIPVLGIIVVIGKYLSTEKDEFIRSMVTQALLWGLGVMMVADFIYAFLADYAWGAHPIPIMNIDIFLVATGIAFRILMWRHQQ